MQIRDIIFRGKRTDNDEWVYGSFCMDAIEQFKGPVGVDGFIRLYNKAKDKMQMHEVDRETVGQYTGLKNRNGERFFEGDIVQRGREIATVEYGEFNCPCCDGVYGWTFNGGDIREGDEYEIVGNIHDNPELMKGEHDPRNCEYFMPDKFGGWGGCLGTKEIDPCEGAKCKCWKQKEG